MKTLWKSVSSYNTIKLIVDLAWKIDVDHTPPLDPAWTSVAKYFKTEKKCCILLHTKIFFSNVKNDLAMNHRELNWKQFFS